MSDFPTPNSQHSEKVNEHGLLFALLIALGIIACLAVVGAFGTAGDSTAQSGDAITNPPIPID
jgi:hypothetical protein